MSEGRGNLIPSGLMPVQTGATIGPYKVDREIGRGGMGVIFLAHDTRLGRTVALKALPEDVASDSDRLQRFEREARVLASLNHPNIAAIHGLEESGGRRYLALELIEGETLSDRIAHGSLPLHEALDILIQIASGMEAAHDAGVVHRDLKPANVMITPNDQVKILDFGLAKGKVATDEEGLAKSPALIDSPTLSSPTLPHSPTFINPSTMAGVILGTAAYLSPEQARGKVVDRPADRASSPRRPSPRRGHRRRGMERHTSASAHRRPHAPHAPAASRRPNPSVGDRRTHDRPRRKTTRRQRRRAIVGASLHAPHGS